MYRTPKTWLATAVNSGTLGAGVLGKRPRKRSKQRNASKAERSTRSTARVQVGEGIGAARDALPTRPLRHTVTNSVQNPHTPSAYHEMKVTALILCAVATVNAQRASASLTSSCAPGPGANRSIELSGTLMRYSA